MINSQIIKCFIIGVAGFLISCNVNNNSGLEESVKDIIDGQDVIVKKIAALEKSINSLAAASKNQPPNKKQPPKADPNKVYNVPIGDSFSKGPKDAAVTLIEWSDFQ